MTWSEMPRRPEPLWCTDEESVGIDGLVGRVQSGETEARDELLSAVRSLVIAYCDGQSSLDNEAGIDTSEDVAQEVLLVVFSAVDEYRVNGRTTFVTWVSGIARRKLSDSTRRAMSAARVCVLGDPPDGPSDEPMTDDQVISSMEFARIIGLLAPGQQVVLGLRMLQESKAADVAAVLEVSPTAVRASQHRAIAALRRRRHEVCEWETVI